MTATRYKAVDGKVYAYDEGKWVERGTALTANGATRECWLITPRGKARKTSDMEVS